MSDCINRVIVSGNLGADPELRYAQGGNAILHLRLCCTTSYVDRDRQRRERQAWIPVTVFGKRGEALSRFLSKGAYVTVEGSLQTGTYEDRDGNKRNRFDVIADNIVLPPRASGERQRAETGDGETPERGSRRGPAREAPPDQPPPEDDRGGFGGDDDIPF